MTFSPRAKIFLILPLLAVLLASIGFAQTSETPEQKLARMLSAFDTPGYQVGVIIVSFGDDITKEVAIGILDKFDLTITQSRVCGPEEAGPDSPPSGGPQNCVTQDNWDDGLKIAYVRVSEGQEKSFAETEELLKYGLKKIIN